MRKFIWNSPKRNLFCPKLDIILAFAFFAFLYFLPDFFEFMFKLLDNNETGILTFRDLATFLGTLLRGDPTEKLTLLYRQANGILFIKKMKMNGGNLQMPSSTRLQYVRSRGNDAAAVQPIQYSSINYSIIHIQFSTGWIGVGPPRFPYPVFRNSIWTTPAQYIRHMCHIKVTQQFASSGDFYVCLTLFQLKPN